MEENLRKIIRTTSIASYVACFLAAGIGYEMGNFYPEQTKEIFNLGSTSILFLGLAGSASMFGFRRPIRSLEDSYKSMVG